MDVENENQEKCKTEVKEIKNNQKDQNKSQTEIKQQDANKEPQDSNRKIKKKDEAQSQQIKPKEKLDNDKIPFSCIPRLEKTYKDISFDNLGTK